LIKKVKQLKEIVLILDDDQIRTVDRII